MLVDEHRNRIVLGERVGSPGGEGTTHAVVGRNDIVAKIYHSHRLPDQLHCEKLKRQTSAQSPNLRRISAWPQELLFDEGRTVGFLMPRMPGKSIHLLYRPDDRNQYFPKATWQSLIDVAKNVAAAFHCLHQHDVIMGDVNESNVFVTVDTGEVRLIDCDSFQIKGPNGQIFPCSMFTAGWAPPELIEAPTLINRRTVQHDLFGLAVMIFHLLFMGKHPFAGVPPDHLLENSPSLEELIKQAVFPYSPSRRGSFKPPPNFLTLQALPDEVANLFERAFVTRDRPTADEWFRGLERIELKKCQWGHVFYRRLNDCPWCAIWGNGGGNFFVVVTSGDGFGSSLTEVEKLISAVEKARFPETEKPWEILERQVPFMCTIPSFASMRIPMPQPTEFPAISKEGTKFWIGCLVMMISVVSTLAAPQVIIFGILGFIAGIKFVIDGWINPEYNREIERRSYAPDLIRVQIDNSIKTIQEFSSRCLVNFKDERQKSALRVYAKFNSEKREFESQVSLIVQELKSLRKQANSLPLLRDSLRRQYSEMAQLEAYLRSVRVPRHGIPQIGPVRYSTLVSYGIFTAWDVRKMNGVPGLGPGATELRGWLLGIEGRFRFNSSAPLPSAAEQEVRKNVQTKEQEMLKSYQSIRARWIQVQYSAEPARVGRLLSEAVAREEQYLRGLVSKSAGEFEQMKRELDEKICLYGQALADAGSCPPRL
jgi:DNA-binding helix-hairpin-helix protein with protein kinase domain